MMKILVVAATEMEILPFINAMPAVDYLITGVGAPACMYALTKHLQHTKYDFLIQAGIAGTFKNAYALGETVLVKQDVFADIGIYENQCFFTLFEKGFAEIDVAPFKNGWLVNEATSGFGLQTVNAITVNTVTDELEHSKIFSKKFDADIESMEGAAFHYICICEGLPFLQLRSISNFVGERVKTNWKMKESIESLNLNLVKLVTQLNAG